MNGSKWLYLAAAVLSIAITARAQESNSPTITFINRSGENCLVKVVGATTGFIRVPNGTSKSVSVRGGQYYIVTRYGEAGRYRYMRGDAFQVVESEYSVSEISITLHKVLNGNYVTHPDSGQDF